MITGEELPAVSCAMCEWTLARGDLPEEAWWAAFCAHQKAQHPEDLTLAGITRRYVAGRSW